MSCLTRVCVCARVITNCITRSFVHSFVPSPSSQTGENCAEVKYTTGKWNDASCADKQYFVCQQGASPTPPPTVPPTPAPPTPAPPTPAPTRIANHTFDDDAFDDDLNDDDADDENFHNKPSPITVQTGQLGVSVACFVLCIVLGCVSAFGCDSYLTLSVSSTCIRKQRSW